MSGYFKDTGEMVGDIRGGFRAGAPIAAAAGMVSLTVCYELVKAALLDWRVMLFWKLALSAVLMFIPFHAFLWLNPDFMMRGGHEAKTSVFHWVWAEALVYLNVVICFYFYRKRYLLIERKLNLDTNILHRRLVFFSLGRALKILLVFAIPFLTGVWLLSMFDTFSWLKKSDGVGKIMYFWLLISITSIWLCGLVNFYEFAKEFIQESDVQIENETTEQIQQRKAECINDIKWTWREVRSIAVSHLKIIAWLILSAIVLFVVLVICKKIGIWF